ncbi:O-antigen ligase family protein [Rhizobium rhizoryzae]|uniref:O-antigen ligase-related domain-containing protein n=1 Tax=Rhizobium rhizoryzae TaxID=451876 RepID=A0A7W6LKI7_9HYPH|nr:O-antigen ligase family protein [Rhizobium rhizoryzae]MBB4145926.1 hypothetical protein [Rhizobium rhizoryzae]
MQAIRGGASAQEDGQPLLERVLRTASLCLFILSMIVTLLTHGGVYPAAISVALLLMLASLVITYFTQGVSYSSQRSFYVILGLWAVLFLYGLVQAVPMPSFMPAHPAWDTLSSFGIVADRYLSPSPFHVLSALLTISLPFATALAALLVFRTDHDVDRALRVFGLAGGVLAAFALVQFLLFPKSLMFGEKLFYHDSLTAPFVNRNTAATFYGVTLVALLCQIRLKDLWAFIRHTIDPGRGRRRVKTSVLWVPLASFVTFLALMMTNSRAGIASCAVGLAVFLVGILLVPAPSQAGSGLISSRETKRQRRVFQVTGAMLLVIIAFSVFAGRALLRAEVQGLEDGRFCILPGTLRAIADNVWTGIGPGAFPAYFPAYRDPACGLYGFWELAHNVYLDGFLAFGLIFWVVVAGASVFMIIRLAQGLRQRRSRRPVVWAAIASCFIVGLHSGFDFSVQIPGFSAWWAFFLGLVLTICTNRSKYRKS